MRDASSSRTVTDTDSYAFSFINQSNANERMTAAYNSMEEAEFLLPLPDGRLASYKMILSPFVIYRLSKHPNLYLLLPKYNQKNLNGIIVVASESGIRMCHHKGWPKMLVSKVRNLTECKQKDSIIQIEYYNIPTDIQSSICSNLIKSIQYI